MKTMKTALQAMREAKGLSQAKLGAIAEVHPANVSALEHRQRACWPALRVRLAKALGVPADGLFGPDGWPLEMRNGD